MLPSKHVHMPIREVVHITPRYAFSHMELLNTIFHSSGQSLWSSLGHVQPTDSLPSASLLQTTQQTACTMVIFFTVYKFFNVCM